MPDRLTGRPVLLGVTAAGIETHDRHLTPLRPLGSIPGVYIHAAAISAFLDGAYLSHAGTLGNALLFLLTGVVMGSAAFGLRPWQAAGVFAAFLIGIAAIAIWRFASAGVWLPMAGPYATLIVTYGIGLWFGHSRAVQEAEILATEGPIPTWPGTYFDLASVWSVALKRVDASDAKLKDEYARRAIDMLRKEDLAFLREKANGDDLVKDPDYESLRGRADFQAFLRETEKKLKEGAPSGKR